MLHPIDDKFAENDHNELVVERGADERGISLSLAPERTVDDDEEHHDDDIHTLRDILACNVEKPFVVHPLEDEALHLHELVRDEQREQALARCVQRHVERDCLTENDGAVDEN